MGCFCGTDVLKLPRGNYITDRPANTFLPPSFEFQVFRHSRHSGIMAGSLNVCFDRLVLCKM